MSAKPGDALREALDRAAKADVESLRRGPEPTWTLEEIYAALASDSFADGLACPGVPPPGKLVRDRLREHFRKEWHRKQAEAVVSVAPSASLPAAASVASAYDPRVSVPGDGALLAAAREVIREAGAGFINVVPTSALQQLAEAVRATGQPSGEAERFVAAIDRVFPPALQPILAAADEMAGALDEFFALTGTLGLVDGHDPAATDLRAAHDRYREAVDATRWPDDGGGVGDDSPENGDEQRRESELVELCANEAADEAAEKREAKTRNESGDLAEGAAFREAPTVRPPLGATPASPREILAAPTAEEAWRMLREASWLDSRIFSLVDAHEQLADEAVGAGDGARPELLVRLARAAYAAGPADDVDADTPNWTRVIECLLPTTRVLRGTGMVPAAIILGEARRRWRKAESAADTGGKAPAVELVPDPRVDPAVGLGAIYASYSPERRSRCLRDLDCVAAVLRTIADDVKGRSDGASMVRRLITSGLNATARDVAYGILAAYTRSVLTPATDESDDPIRSVESVTWTAGRIRYCSRVAAALAVPAPAPRSSALDRLLVVARWILADGNGREDRLRDLANAVGAVEAEVGTPPAPEDRVQARDWQKAEGRIRSETAPSRGVPPDECYGDGLYGGCRAVDAETEDREERRRLRLLLSGTSGETLDPAPGDRRALASPAAPFAAVVAFPVAPSGEKRCRVEVDEGESWVTVRDELHDPAGRPYWSDDTFVGSSGHLDAILRAVLSGAVVCYEAPGGGEEEAEIGETKGGRQ